MEAEFRVNWISLCFECCILKAGTNVFLFCVSHKVTHVINGIVELSASLIEK